MELNNINPDKFEIVKKGLTNYTHQQKILDLQHEGVSEYFTSDDADFVDFVSLDDFYFTDVLPRERERERERERGWLHKS